MLRVPAIRARAIAQRSVPVRFEGQWLHWQTRQAAPVAGRRLFAEKKHTDETLLPGSHSKALGEVVPAPTLSPAAPSSTPSAPPEVVPKVPPSPQDVKSKSVSSISPPASSPPSSVPTGHGTATVAPPPGNQPPPPPPSPPKKRSGRFRRFILTLILLSGLSYAGGVYYSLVSDNFHDFFTEYVPFAEDAVGYFEERAFRKRFPASADHTSRYREQVRGEQKVTIPHNSGVSWRVAKEEPTGSDLAGRGRHVSALEDDHPKAGAAKQNPSSATPAEKTKAVDQAKKEAPPADKAAASQPKPTPKDGPALKSDPKPDPKPETKAAAPEPKLEAPKAPPIPLVDPLTIKNAEEPVVTEVVKIVNDIIAVVNADNASGKYSTAMTKAKDDLTKVAGDIAILKSSILKSAEDKIKANDVELDNAAKQLIKRLEDEMREQEARWKEEYESEREKLSKTYQDKLKSELDAAQKVADQRLRNELLEQAIELKRHFAQEVKDRVETERNGRLSKLNELSSSVSDLEKLTSEWNSVIDTNLKTQHLHVAVEAVRSSLEKQDRPKPFIQELAALKEIAADDPVVNAAIASINPTAYQRGIPTSAQLIDRFRRVASEVRKAALLPEDAGVASHAASLILSKFMFRKEGMALGQDVESILTRTETFLEEGSLDEAAREINGLTGWAKTLSKDWLGEVRKVLEVQQALDVIATEARLQSLLVD